MRNANKMADSLQLDGSKLKLTNKIPNNLSTETLTSVKINADNINIEANKTKKSRSDKSENKAIDASGNDDGIIDSISSSLTLSTKTNGEATSIYQQSNRQKKMNQIFTKQELQSHQMNVQNLTKSAKQEKSLMDLQEIEDSRKKRCSDRYDSSESSDSGVATLSITDSSATSSEDASNFDSPYNTPMNNNDLVLLHSNNVKRSKQSQQVSKGSSSNHSQNNKNKQDTKSSAPPSALWPWNVPTDATSQAASTRNLTLANAQNSNTIQTLAVRPSISNDKSTKITSSCNSKNKRNSSSDAHSSLSTKRNRFVQNNAFGGIANNNLSNNSMVTATTLATSSSITQSICSNSLNVRSQTKITGYFKSQVKTLPNLKKDLTNMVVRSIELPAETLSKIETASIPALAANVQCTDGSLHQSLMGASDKITDTLPLVQNSNNNLSVCISSLNGTTQANKIERKTAKVSPISRKSNVMKKPYANVLPKKHVNIAPRAPATPLNGTTMALPTMAHQTKSMLQSNRQRLHVKVFRRQHDIGAQNEYPNQPNDFGVVPTLLTTIHLPTNGNTMAAQTASSQKQPSLTALHPNHSIQPHCKNMQHAQKPPPTKLNGSIYQLHPTSVIQIPVATKETNTQTQNNIVVNNGYFINGAIIKLQQMLSQQQTSPSLTNESQITLPSKANYTQKFNCQSTNAKLASTTNLIHDSQSLANHNDLSQRFVTNGPSNSQYAQPTVFIPTSSGLLLTTALPAMITSQLSNLQPLNQQQQQQQQMPPLHQFNQQQQQSHAENKLAGDKSSIHGHSIEKRQLRPCIIPSPALTVTLAENSLQSNYLTNNTFPYNVLTTTSTGIQSNCNQNQMNGIDKNANVSNRLYSAGTATMPSTNLTYAPRTITAMLNDTSNKKSVDATKLTEDVQQRTLPITFSVSSPPPLCVQSTKELIPLNNEKIDFHSFKANATSTSSAAYAQNNLNMEKNGWSCDYNEISRIKSENCSITKLTNNRSNNISMNERNDLSGQPHRIQPALVQIQKIKHDDSNQSTDHSRRLNLESNDHMINGHSKSTILTSTLTPTQTTIDTNLIGTMLPACSKSPILSQPKTIRFPANGSRNRDSRTAGCCIWDDCNENCETSSNLLDHLQTKHVNSQQAPFSCRWANCKVHGRESCSRKWLERHVLSHGGSKLFKCIFEKCRMRFGSQLALQKHVNGHINSTENKDSTVRRSSDPPVPKKLRMNGKRLRYRRQPFSARMFDYFDNGVMEELQHRLLKTVNLTNCLNGTITFKGKSIGRRVTATGSVELLIKWNPCDIISDEWISANKPTFTKTMQLTSLTQSERVSLLDHLNYSYKFPTNCSSLSSTVPKMTTNKSTKIADKS